ncbi:MAG: EAL domain-containing protein [Nitrosomonadaceae bacterium]|nr:EAL domain-containing protein [Nitrosomonadaceae bacterium]
MTAIYFTRSDLLWIAFLSGVLVASIIAMAVRATHIELIVARHTMQLLATEEKLAQEIKLHLWAEKAAAASKARLQFIGEKFPAMIAYVDAEQRCCYHNTMFRQWLGLNPDQVDGRPLREVLGNKFYGEIESFLTDVMAGKTVHAEHIQELTHDSIHRLSGQYFPDSDNEGKVGGFCLLYTPMIEGKASLPGDAERGTRELNRSTMHTEPREKSLFDESLGEQASEWGVSAASVAQAIEEDEFRLYCQAITPIKTDKGLCVHHEILLRMAEEEDNLLPPGAFLPAVERHDMMTHLDRWVVSQMLQWLSVHQPALGTIFFINLTRDTLSDTGFADFVLNQLQKTGVLARVLCFEIEEADVTLRLADTSAFVQKIRQYGCQVALCGFGRKHASFDLLRNIKVNFLKIDGGLVCNMLHDPISLAKIVSINRVAHTIGIQTVAESVETDEVIAKLRELEVDFAQGFGIGRPRVLKEIE